MTKRRFGATSWMAGTAMIWISLAACEPTEGGLGPGSGVAPPRAFDAFYFDRSVHLTWELDVNWDGEPFRVYAKRTTDPEFFLVAEVTSCAAGFCEYTDTNVRPETSYEYFVAAVDPDTGEEAAVEVVLEVFVPEPVPPPVPGGPDAVALDGAVFVHWDERSREVEDFSFYRIYLEEPGGAAFLLGETDSEGFLDLLAENGETYEYFVTAVDDRGHESEGSLLATATPRPDFHGELLHAFEDEPELSGFRFQDSDAVDPVVPGDSPDRDFRLEVDSEGWWLVPGPEAEVHTEAFFTTALRCGPAADQGCADVRTAPASGYSAEAVELVPEYSYVLRVGSPGSWWYGVIRVTHVGSSQSGAVVLFDWAFQLQAGNRALIVREPR